MDVLRKEDIYTIEDIYNLPDGERAELIDGKIYYRTILKNQQKFLPLQFF